MAKRKKTLTDPFAEREATKYESPIASREFILQVLSDNGKPMTWQELSHALNMHDEESRTALRRRLRAMERDGQLLFNRRGGYVVADKVSLIRGIIIGHKDGFGFVKPEDGSEDLFLSPREMRAVFDGDRVLVQVTRIDRRGRREAAIVEVLERKTQRIVGRLFIEKGIAFVVPDSKRITQEILIAPEDLAKAKRGQIVVAEITTPPTVRSQAIGKIVEILGEHLAPGLEVDMAMRAFYLPHEWSEGVLEQIKKIKPIVTAKDVQGRVDIRDLPLATIDGEDAQDFDDAVYCEKRKGGGWRLLVAIADVSHYVKPYADLDHEAQQRGNSVYFPGRVIPMLPEILSNELCSLKPLVDRLCMVCEMTLSKNGQMTRYKFYPAVMHSHARLTYNQVAAMLVEKNEQLIERHASLYPHLQELYNLYQVLRENREARGALDFETVETRIIFDDHRKIKAIVPTQRNEAHKLIEECMLAANVAAAQFLEKAKIPALYRVHDGPNPEKLTDLREFLREFNLGLAGGANPTPQDYAELLAVIKGRPDANLIQTVLLRSLRQAVYSAESTGHFGLALENYAHFTSPIRRYPDLLVHRAIRYVLQNEAINKYTYTHAEMERLGEQCSMTERRADEATRDAVERLKCEYMQEKIGEQYTGIISGVAGFGIFVQLEDVYVEGLVHVTALKNDYYQYDPIRHRLRGERTGIQYRLGDKVNVKISFVNMEDRKIDLELIKDDKRMDAAFGKKRSKPTANGLLKDQIVEHKASGKKTTGKSKKKNRNKNRHQVLHTQQTIGKSKQEKSAKQSQQSKSKKGSKLIKKVKQSKVSHKATGAKSASPVKQAKRRQVKK